MKPCPPVFLKRCCGCIVFLAGGCNGFQVTPPQRLKPHRVGCVFGTAEAVPSRVVTVLCRSPNRLCRDFLGGKPGSCGVWFSARQERLRETGQTEIPRASLRLGSGQVSRRQRGSEWFGMTNKKPNCSIETPAFPNRFMALVVNPIMAPATVVNSSPSSSPA